MLTDAEISALFRDMEADRVERKRDYKSSADKIRQAICAFANDLADRRAPGIVFIGQNDDGSCAGIDINDELLRTLGGLRTEILPFPVMSVARREIDGCAVVVVEVAPSQQPPVRVDGRTWIRVGPRRATATPEEERRLAEKQVWRNLPFDSRPVLDASLQDLDLLRFEEEYAPSATSPEIQRQNGRSTEEKVRALRLISREDNPAAAAILLFGKNPRAYFPGAYVQFLRIDGPNLVDPILDQKEIGGTVPDQVRQCDADKSPHERHDRRRQATGAIRLSDSRSGAAGSERTPASFLRRQHDACESLLVFGPDRVHQSGGFVRRGDPGDGLAERYRL